MKATKLLLATLLALATLTGLWMLRSSLDAPAPLIGNAILRPLHGAPGAWALTARIDNRGGPDTLLAAHSPEAGALTIEGTQNAAIPAGSAPSLSLDGVFVRLTGLGGGAQNGRLVPITLVFAQAGEVTARARLATAAPQGGMAHAMPGHAASLDLAADQAPVLALNVQPEPKGWSLALDLRNLTLTARGADGPHKPGAGHGHLYLNGLKLQRMYEPSAFIGALPPGPHTIRVTLNTNDHRPFAVNGEPIEATAKIVQPK